MRSHFVMVAYGRSGRWAVRAKRAAAGGSTRRISMKDFSTRLFKVVENNISDNTLDSTYCATIDKALFTHCTEVRFTSLFSGGFTNLNKSFKNLNIYSLTLKSGKICITEELFDCKTPIKNINNGTIILVKVRLLYCNSIQCNSRNLFLREAYFLVFWHFGKAFDCFEN